MKKHLKKALCLILSAAFTLMSIPAANITAGDKASSLKSNTLHMTIGEKTKIKIKNKKSGATYKFKVTGKSVAKVNKKGRITALSEGFAGISVKEVFKGKTRKLGTISLTVDERIPNDNFINSTADFSVNLFKKTCLNDIKAGKNTLMSSESVINALMLLTEGAKGDTFDELTQTITGGISFEDYRDELMCFNNKLTVSQYVKFHLANSVWVKDDENDIKVKDDYRKNVKKYYGADFFARPFNSDTVDEINGWVSDNTDAMIPQLLDELSPDAVAVLLNALCFDGEWAEQYQSVSKDEDFTNSKGVKEKANMLYGTEHSYISDDKAIGFIKPYKGHDYSFMAILPNEDVGVEKYLEDLTGQDLIDLYNSEGSDETHTKIPEFKYDYSAELKDPLKAMGINKAFDPYGCDITGMGTTSFENLFVSKVIHKTHIELDKNGTKAAAATAVVIGKGAAAPSHEEPKEVYLDRPFIYAIVDTDTGIPVFLGVVNTLQ